MRLLKRHRHHDDAFRLSADWAGLTSKGKQYRTIVCHAGLAWGKGDFRKAIAALQEGMTLATENGDVEIVRVLPQDLKRYQCAAAGEELDPSR